LHRSYVLVWAIDLSLWIRHHFWDAGKIYLSVMSLAIQISWASDPWRSVVSLYSNALNE
jgi:hypothetical protein